METCLTAAGILLIIHFSLFIFRYFMTFIFRYFKSYKGVLALTLLLAAINQVFSLLDPQVFRLIIDRYVTNFQDYDTRSFVIGVG
jgi:ATP-binding cassette subfamily B protein